MTNQIYISKSFQVYPLSGLPKIKSEPYLGIKSFYLFIVNILSLGTFASAQTVIRNYRVLSLQRQEELIVDNYEKACEGYDNLNAIILDITKPHETQNLRIKFKNLKEIQKQSTIILNKKIVLSSICLLITHLFLNTVTLGIYGIYHNINLNNQINYLKKRNKFLQTYFSSKYNKKHKDCEKILKEKKAIDLAGKEVSINNQLNKFNQTVAQLGYLAQKPLTLSEDEPIEDTEQPQNLFNLTTYVNTKTASEVIVKLFSAHYKLESANRAELEKLEKVILSPSTYYPILALLVEFGIIESADCRGAELKINNFLSMRPSRPEKIGVKMKGGVRIEQRYKRSDDFTPSQKDLKLPKGVNAVELKLIWSNLSSDEKVILKCYMNRCEDPSYSLQWIEQQFTEPEKNQNRIKLVKKAARLTINLCKALSIKFNPIVQNKINKFKRLIK